MALAPLVKCFTSRTYPAVGNILYALTDRLVDIGARGRVQQPLICFRVLHHDLGLAVDSQDHRPLALFDLFDELTRFAPEICQRLMSLVMSSIANS